MSNRDSLDIILDSRDLCETGYFEQLISERLTLFHGPGMAKCSRAGTTHPFGGTKILLSAIGLLLCCYLGGLLSREDLSAPIPRHTPEEHAAYAAASDNPFDPDRLPMTSTTWNRFRSGNRSERGLRGTAWRRSRCGFSSSSSWWRSVVTFWVILYPSCMSEKSVNSDQVHGDERRLHRFARVWSPFESVWLRAFSKRSTRLVLLVTLLYVEGMSQRDIEGCA